MTTRYTVIVKASEAADKTRHIIGWQSYDTKTPPPPPQTSDFVAIEVSGLTDHTWPPHIQPNDISNLGLDPIGKIVSFPQIPYKVPLSQQAQTALHKVQQQATLATAMGQTFGPHMHAYVTTLQAIANGSDTTRTALPEVPTEVTG